MEDHTQISHVPLTHELDPALVKRELAEFHSVLARPITLERLNHPYGGPLK